MEDRGIRHAIPVVRPTRGEMERVKEFKYLGSFVTGTEGLEKEISHSIHAVRMNCKRVSRMLYNGRITKKTEVKVFKSVRPVMIYGRETWLMKIVREKKLNLVEMGMLRWMDGGKKHGGTECEMIQYGRWPLWLRLRRMVSKAIILV